MLPRLPACCPPRPISSDTAIYVNRPYSVRATKFVEIDSMNKTPTPYIYIYGRYLLIQRATGIARSWFHQRGFKMLERQHRIIGASFSRLALDLAARLQPGTCSTAIVEEPLALDWRVRKPSFSIIALTLLWKSQAWWDWQQALMTTVDAQNSLRWRHRRTGPLVTWEKPLVKTFGSKWMQLAITPVWQDSKSKFVDGAYAGLSTQTLEQGYRKSKTVESEPKASAACPDAENLSQTYDSS